MGKKRKAAANEAPAAAAAAPSYLHDCPPAFVRAADMTFVVEGAELPVHSQLLSRYCGFFAGMFEDVPQPGAGGGGAGGSSGPLRLEEPFQGVRCAHAELFLSSIYSPARLEEMVAAAPFTSAEVFTGVYELADRFDAGLLKAALQRRLAAGGEEAEPDGEEGSGSAYSMLERNPMGWMAFAER